MSVNSNTDKLELKSSLPTTIDTPSDDTQNAPIECASALDPSRSSERGLILGGLSLLPNLKQRSGSARTTVRSATSSTNPLRVVTDVTGSQPTRSHRRIQGTGLASDGDNQLEEPRPPTLRRAETEEPHVTYSPDSSLCRTTTLSPLSKQSSLDLSWTSTAVKLNDQESADPFWDRTRGDLVKQKTGSPVRHLHRTLRSMGSFDWPNSTVSPSSPSGSEEPWLSRILRRRTKEDDEADAEMFGMVRNPTLRVCGPATGIQQEEKEPEPEPEPKANRSSLEELGERFSTWGTD